MAVANNNSTPKGEMACGFKVPIAIITVKRARSGINQLGKYHRDPLFSAMAAPSFAPRPKAVATRASRLTVVPEISLAISPRTKTKTREQF